MFDHSNDQLQQGSLYNCIASPPSAIRPARIHVSQDTILFHLLPRVLYYLYYIRLCCYNRPTYSTLLKCVRQFSGKYGQPYMVPYVSSDYVPPLRQNITNTAYKGIMNVQPLVLLYYCSSYIYLDTNLHFMSPIIHQSTNQHCTLRKKV